MLLIVGVIGADLLSGEYRLGLLLCGVDVGLIVGDWFDPGVVGAVLVGLASNSRLNCGR